MSARLWRRSGWMLLGLCLASAAIAGEPPAKGLKAPPRKDHDCEKGKCAQQTQPALMEEFRKRCAQVVENPDEKAEAELEAFARRYVGAEKTCMELLKKIRRELEEEKRRRIAEQEARARRLRPPEHKCEGANCAVCRQHKEKIRREDEEEARRKAEQEKRDRERREREDRERREREERERRRREEEARRGRSGPPPSRR